MIDYVSWLKELAELNYYLARQEDTIVQEYQELGMRYEQVAGLLESVVNPEAKYIIEIKPITLFKVCNSLNDAVLIREQYKWNYPNLTNSDFSIFVSSKVKDL